MRQRLPFEVSIETSTACNYKCGFCFAKNYASGCSAKPQGKKRLLLAIKRIAESGVQRVRFTGGEPLLRRDLPEIVSSAKKQGLFTSLNTNGSLFSEKIVRQLSGSLDDALFSVHAFDGAGEAALSGKKGLFEKKIAAIKSLASEGVFVRAATILSRPNIKNLEKFHSLVSTLPTGQWVLLRPIPNAADMAPVSQKEIGAAVEKLLLFNGARKKKERFLIENALPFCCYLPEKVSEVALGGIREDGHSSLFINARMRINPSYFLGLPLGNALEKGSIESAWNSVFMRRMRALEFIADECHKCRFVLRCMSGSRFSALLCNGSLYALDPLANPGKYAKSLFKQT